MRATVLFGEVVGQLADTPWGTKAFVLVRALSHSGRFRCWFSDSDDQAHLVVGIDEVLRRLGGTPRRWRDGPTVGELAEMEPLLALPAAPYPAEAVEVRTVAANARISLWGNRYSVPPGLVGGHVQIRCRLGESTISVYAQGRQVRVHRLAPRGAQQTTRLPEHTAALENVVLDAFNTDKPCRHKINQPPSDAALALAAELIGKAAAADP